MNSLSNLTGNEKETGKANAKCEIQTTKTLANLFAQAVAQISIVESAESKGNWTDLKKWLLNDQNQSPLELTD